MLATHDSLQPLAARYVPVDQHTLEHSNASFHPPSHTLSLTHIHAYIRAPLSLLLTPR